MSNSFLAAWVSSGLPESKDFLDVRSWMTEQVLSATETEENCEKNLTFPEIGGKMYLQFKKL